MWSAFFCAILFNLVSLSAQEHCSESDDLKIRFSETNWSIGLVDNVGREEDMLRNGSLRHSHKSRCKITTQTYNDCRFYDRNAITKAGLNRKRRRVGERMKMQANAWCMPPSFRDVTTKTKRSMGVLQAAKKSANSRSSTPALIEHGHCAYYTLNATMSNKTSNSLFYFI